jgi:hypothetical protein
MKPVDQTKFGEGDGNCFEAILASILEIPLDGIPSFGATSEPEGWMDDLNEWLQQFGVQAIQIMPTDRHMELLHGCYCEATIRSPRFYWLYHSVVVKGGEVVHDPHPSRASLGKADRLVAVTAFVSIDPAKENK